MNVQLDYCGFVLREVEESFLVVAFQLNRGGDLVCLSQHVSSLALRFGHKLHVSDLYKLTDTVAIREQGNGRLVCLLPSSQARQSPLGSSQSHDGSSTNCSPIIFEELEYHEPVCRQHCSNKDFRYSSQISFCVRSWTVLALHSLEES